MRRVNGTYSFLQRMGALLLAAVMVFGLIPTTTVAADDNMLRLVGQTNTVSDPATHNRLDGFYGQSTLNAGKITVDKSVSDSAVTLNYGASSHTFTPGDDNFIVTVSQAAQVMGLASESSVPLDVVFILDTSGSMDDDNRAENMVTAANDAISTLMSANEHNRVAVVAFSSNDRGGVCSEGAAANVLSSLAHYTGDAATNHLQWVTDKGATTGENRRNIAGRDTMTVTIEGEYWWEDDEEVTVNAYRRGYYGGTNIQAGIIAGAKLLTADSTTTTVTTESGVVTRMPFIVILSDGQPTYSIDNATWYDPTSTTQQGDGNNDFAGNGFLPALVAAYYKAKITEKYYGTNASEDNRCSIYTIGVQLNEDLAEMTLDPSEHFVAGSGNDYYSSFNTYWTNFSRATPQNFNISVNDDDNFRITADSIRAARDAVNGKSSTGVAMYEGGLQYNDDHFAADDTDDIAKAFREVVTSIQKKAMSSPTRVDATFGADFSGYVTFTDPIGEYMEVKQMYGIVANGKWYRGQTFAQYMQNWSSAPQSFRDSFIKVLEQRCKLSGANVDVNELINNVVASPNQAYYNNSGYDNSIVWWGNGFTAEGEEDEQVQILGYADNDTIEYITDPNTDIPEGADYVCRSYFYYGTAGDPNVTPDEEFLYFVVRVQRSLTAPYQETVVVSAPASLLSVEQVMITESVNADGEREYTAAVTPAEPAHVVYEVGLRGDINPFNVDQIVGEDTVYVDETAKIDGETRYTNYANGVYTFYTNDWNRNEPEGSHHRAAATATFDAAADNSFYTYQEDTLIYVKQGESYVSYTGTTKPSGNGYYYAREYYEWSGNADQNGNYAAEKKTAYIAVDIPANAEVNNTDGQWYIPKGLYKASSLTGGENVYKDDPATTDVWNDGNFTETSDVVSHPHRTDTVTNSHYTVVLGNNGKLTLRSEKTKSVDINADEPTGIINADGQAVMVGDELTYTIKVINGGDVTANAEATDTIPAGTKYVDGSASHGGVYDETTGIIKWELKDIAAGDYVEVSFKVVVTEAAISGSNDVVNIDNTAYVKLDNQYGYETNTTTNPPEGKKVVDTEGKPIQGSVSIPQVLVYRIQWHNDAVDANGMPAEATVTVTDIIPEGTSYVTDSASHNGVYNAKDKTMTWTFKAAPGASGVVSFRVNVNAAAGETIQNGASIQVNNNPRVTNKTEVKVLHGNLILSKEVETNGFTAAENQEFTLNIVEIGRGMNGTYKLVKNGNAVAEGITFVNGVATVTIKHGDVLEIEDIPVGATISVTEQAKPGFTPAYYVNGSTEANKAEGRVTIAQGENKVDVTNTYDPLGVTFHIEGKKQLETSFDVEDTVFGFVANPVDVNGDEIADAAHLTGEVTVSSEDGKKEATISFSPVSFTTPGTYYYLISEINGGLGGVTYADEQYLVTITVTDDGSGQLKAEPEISVREGTSGAFADASGIVFVNSYAPQETQLTLAGKKVLNGRTLQDNEFSFIVTDSADKIAATGYNKGGEIIFTPITYTAPGTYTYTITEVNGGAHGMQYSEDKYTVTVTVEDVDGKLVAKENYTNLAAGETVPTFTNTYTPDGISVVLEAEKELVGRGLKANEFNFVVKDSLDNTVATGMNDADGKIVFSPIGYTVDDAGKTFTYTVSEVIPDLARDPYMSYDQTEFNVEITVSYDNVQGKLSANVTYPAAGIKFINTQHPSSIDVFPQASKTTLDTTGNTTHVPGDATFSFVVVNVKNGEEAAVGVGPANDKVTFSSLTFTQAGEYLYWIKESHGEHKAHGITYDPTVYLMKVVVTHDDGKLDFTTTYYTMRDGGQADIAADYTVAVPAGTVPTFKNTYDAQGHIAITAKKVLNELVLKDGDFAFRLVREGVTDAGITGVVTISDVVKDGDDVLYSTGDVKFATLYFDLGEFAGSETTKTIHYVMSEIEPPVAKIPGVTYDKTAYDVYITIEHKNDGTIDAWVSDANGNRLTDANGNLLAANDSNVTFTNTYAPQQGTSATISGTKTLIGRTLKAGEFAFQLIHVENGTETLVDTVANAADGTFSFTRNYPATILDSADSRVIKYFVREVNSHLGGVKYDTNAFAAVVTIVDNKAEGRLEATTAYYALKENGDPANIEDYTVDLGNDVPTFANTYTVKETTYAPVVKKTLNNRDLTAGEFSFIITDGSGNVVSTGTNEAALAGEQANIIFSPIGFDKATTAGAEPIYTVTEVKGSLPGMGYDDTVFYLKVTVVDNGDGTLTPTGAFFTDEACTKPIDGQAPEFVNTYTPANVSLQLEADKILTGRDMEAGEFSFVVLDEHNKVVATGGNAAAAAGATADVIFSHIGYSLADVGNTYTYTIKELSTGQGGVTFHGNAFYAKVKITNDQAAGKLVPSVEYFSDIECNTKQDNIIFGNNYAPTDATLKLPVDKTLINKVLEADEFTFNLYQTGSDFKILGNPIQSTTNDEHGVVDFTALSFNRPGKYYYVVSEAVTDGDPDKLYTLDDPFQVIVTVTDNLKGQLVATAEYFVNYTEGGENTNLGGIEFINYYTAPALTVPLSTQIGAKKTVNTPNGITYSPEGFRFSITDVTGSIIKGFAQDENGNWVQVDMIGTSDADGNITFPNFRFATAGAYRYRLQEMDSNKGGIAEDGRVWEIHILVRYNETTGLLYVADSDVQTYLISDNGSAASKPAFVNTYTAEPTKLYLTASKKLTGIRELKDREFTLYLMERDPMGRDIIVASGYNDVNGNVRFEVPYTEVGTHFYSVKEYIPREGHGGVTYDETVYASLTVDVRDNGEGQLVAYVGGKAVSNGATITTGVTVTNRYDAKEAAAVILAHKAMLGDRPLNEGEFTFELVDSEGEVIATAVNNHDGHVEFVLDGYKTPGEYTYTLREKKGSLGGVTYDPTNHIVTVIVVDDGVGQLHASVAYNTEDGHAPIFTNSYKAAAVQAEIKAHKTLSGEKPLAAEKYTFELVDSEGNIITATNNAAGDVVFTLDYEEVGEHTYTLREKKGDEPGTTYDDTVYTVHVKVADNLNGKLVATVVYKDVEAGKVPGFINVYKGAEVPVLITAQKKLEGRALKADEFTFVLVNTKNEKETYTATNDANGNVGFNLTFKDSGVYTYTLYEKTGTDGYITYDDASYTVTVTVTDGLDGYMKAEVAYGTTDGSAPVFENVHTPGAVNVVLEGTKTLTGADLADYVFEFQVRDSDNKVVAEGKNDAKGNITFAGIGLNKAGTYTYTVTERNTGVKNVSYDTASFTVKVEVTDENGVLKAKVIYPEGGIKFANEYKQPDPGAIQVVLEGKKTMIGAKLGDCVFEFQVRDSEKNVVAEGKNDAKGNLVFDAITFDKAGTYTYTVTERNTAMKYVKYDTTSFTVKVEVTEEDGELKAKVTYPDGEIEFKNEYKKPDPGSPDTGDRFPLVPVLIVMALSGVLLIVLLLPRKKKGAYQK